MTTTTSCASAHRDSNTAEHLDHRADCHLNTATGRPLSPNSSKLRFAISLAVYPNRTIGSVGRSTVRHGRREGLSQVRTPCQQSSQSQQSRQNIHKEC